jgi:hypothetical protein
MLDAISHPASEMINAVGYKTGLASIGANIGIVASIEAGVIGLADSWGMPETALLASTAVSIMWFFRLRSGIKKDKCDMMKTQLEMELMKKKAEQDDNE